MRKILTQGLVVANILACSTVAFAGFSETKWNFASDESVTIKAADTIHQGVEYACKAFKPKKASFVLSYSSPSDLDKLKIVADNEKKITHDKEHKVFTLKGVKSLHISFPSSGHYTFKNITKKKVIGINCDTGDYD
ncbi:hypothetical protein BHOIPH791_00610 [Bartonella henselae]|uniref:Uncharacterized protein n=1 Tax=Bartonella henselae (strain ATCC 49882 / DSM 28221 / CCUG 30454 / Houston 1) TaxID=283166 RepID=A0A0H3M248_BARHE|nr:hypothetical protein [Bartonella henselae]ATP11867.1 hypothetical protein BhenCHDE101_01205 [Bartonella henselae]ETS10203.1 hypothetical protein Q654_00485 [Bartonella henselae JK 50]ETS10710.1 hypothetical protein Q655_00433 [Bartonella henselae JK 51]OLL40826.1 hypothetical protein AT244_05360 [Bartonella henselae]OLL43176.1 hypothetical protein AT245_02625 [Bartonella henselae]